MVSFEYLVNPAEAQAAPAWAAALGRECQDAPFDRLAWWSGLHELCLPDEQPLLALAISTRAPLSATICAACARLSSGFIGTYTRPARAAASGIRQASSLLGSQQATRAPGSGTVVLNQPASCATRALNAS